MVVWFQGVSTTSSSVFSSVVVASTATCSPVVLFGAKGFHTVLISMSDIDLDSDLDLELDIMLFR